METENKFTDMGNDIIKFIECTDKYIKPHNMLLYNIIMNALEMMIIRYEDSDKVIGFECTNSNDSVTVMSPKRRNVELYVPEDIKNEVDTIIDDVFKDLEKETKEE